MARERAGRVFACLSPNTESANKRRDVMPKLSNNAVLRKLSAVRRKNNTNYMRLGSLVQKHYPAQAEKIFNGISAKHQKMPGLGSKRKIKATKNIRMRVNDDTIKLFRWAFRSDARKARKIRNKIVKNDQIIGQCLSRLH